MFVVMSLSDIAEYIFTEASPDGRRKTMRWLQTRGLLATQMSCTCAGTMYLTERDLNRGNQDDKWAWRCPECTSIRSIRSGSWFEGQQCIMLTPWLLLWQPDELLFITVIIIVYCVAKYKLQSASYIATDKMIS